MTQPPVHHADRGARRALDEGLWGLEANDAALRASTSWLIAEGLGAELYALRLPAEEDPIPTPGFARILHKAEEALRECTEASDRIQRLLRDPEPTTAVIEMLDELAEIAEARVDDVESSARRLAQLAFGVSSCLAPSERVERLDRAACAVLYPPMSLYDPVGLVDDGIVLFSRSPEELGVEIGGIICRMLTDRRVQVQIGGITLQTGTDGVLRLTTPTSESTWASPVQVSEPARDAVAALSGSMGSDQDVDASRLEVTVRRFDHVALP